MVAAHRPAGMCDTERRLRTTVRVTFLDGFRPDGPIWCRTSFCQDRVERASGAVPVLRPADAFLFTR